MQRVLARIGFNRAFLVNPVTWVATALVGIGLLVANSADQHYDDTCAAIAPAVIGITGLDEYFVQIWDNKTYEHCLGRIPARWEGQWPLTDCSPGGVPHYSSGAPAWFPQKCRFDTGVYQVF
ncbi:MAG: hypothetical protein O2905_06360 [Proteobacteria bacterium]|nr:hypothetical protein [Pseudomonadota bacterium]